MADTPSTGAQPRYELYYWPGLPGRGEFIRLAFNLHGTPFILPGGRLPWLWRAHRGGAGGWGHSQLAPAPCSRPLSELIPKYLDYPELH
jgi:hypothetical protein